MLSGDKPYGLLHNAAVGVCDGIIEYVGPLTSAPDAKVIIDCKQRLITPALIDCHTHIIYGGNRASEFAMRMRGASYAEIAKNGGGIQSTVQATRNATADELLSAALERLDYFLAEGVATIEIKSGYGLDFDNEIKMLRVARELAKQRNIRVITSFLGAHAIPHEFADNADGYIDYIIEELLPYAAKEGLVDAVDGFCEHIAFSNAQIARLFTKAKELNLPIKLHAEQLSNQQSAVMAAKMGALSVDHLEYLTAEDVAILAQNNTVAVLLPAAFYNLRETQLPPISALRSAAVPIAVATDCNPGSAPILSMLTTMNMACILFNLTIEESLAGTTKYAAQALGLQHKLGTIEVGKIADMAIWNISTPDELFYNIGLNPLHMRVVGGKAECS